MKKKLLIICGPTAVGKTKLGIECAKVFGGEIISADCMQVYKKLDIGTAKATPTEQAQAKHHLIDIVEPNESYSVGDFKQDATKIINELYSQNKLPIVVGGTGFYIESLLFPYSFGSCEQNLSVRQKYNNLAQEKGNEYVFDLLKQVDPKSCEKLHPNDIKRVIRALEIFETTGKPKSQQNTQKISDYDYKIILLNCDRQVLYDRINKRVDVMLAEGLEQEVQNLVASGISKANQCMQGIGYKEFFDYFENKITHEQLVEKIKQDSRNYAKRQLTWFRHMDNIEEFNIDNIEQILFNIKNWLNKGEKNMKTITIAIDGPSGSGKSTIANALAKKLNILFLSTGSIYRAFGLACKLQNLNPESETDAQKALSNTVMVEFRDGKQCVILNGTDVTEQINNEEIGKFASLISKHKCVREKCVDIQRQIASNQSIVVDGRDIGSVVLPNADYKFYLDADVSERAKRRYKDLTNRGINTTLQEVEDELKERDYNDIHRKLSPLVQVKDAIKIDSTHLTIEQVIDKFIEIIEK